MLWKRLDNSDWVESIGHDFVYNNSDPLDGNVFVPLRYECKAHDCVAELAHKWSCCGRTRVLVTHYVVSNANGGVFVEGDIIPVYTAKNITDTVERAVQKVMSEVTNPTKRLWFSTMYAGNLTPAPVRRGDVEEIMERELRDHDALELAREECLHREVFAVSSFRPLSDEHMTDDEWDNYGW